MTHEWLSDARKIPDDVMSYIRKIAVRAVVEFGWSPECVYKIFGISRSCLYDWLSSFRRGGYEALETRLPPGAEPLITREMDVWLKWVVLSRTPSDYGYDTALWTCGILAALLAREFGVKVIGATVNAHLKKLELSYQVPRYRASEQDPVEIERFLNDTFPRVKRYAEKRGAEIAFEDEAGVHLDAHAGRTWGARGETPEVIATDKRGKFNILSIVTPEGNLQFSLKAGNIDSDTYIGFLKQLLTERKRLLILFVDHASFHGSKKVREFHRANRHRIRIYFFPGHAPEHNPTEQLWGEVKNNRIGRQPVKNKTDLKKRLNSALRSVQHNAKRILSFFQLPDTEYASQ
jgi:transposase